MMIGKLICMLIRRFRKGKHKWVEGRCARCGRKQPKVRA